MDRDVCIETQLLPKEIFRAAHLDFPSEQEKLTLASDGTLKFIGWVVPRDLEAIVAISVTRARGEDVLSERTVDRPDVVRKLLQEEEAPPSALGFSVRCEPGAVLQVALLVDGQRYPWKRVSLPAFPKSEADRYLDVWQALCRNQLSDELETEVAALSHLSKETINSLLFGSEDLAPRSGQMSSILSTTKAYVAFRSFLASPEFSSELVQSASISGHFEVPSPTGTGVARCSESYRLDENVSLLRFIDDESSEVFYVFQRVTACDGVYFPLRGRYDLFQHLPREMALRLLAGHLADLKASLPYMRNAGSNRWLGITAGFGRPYHFFYDVAPAVHGLYTAGLLESVPHIACFNGTDFISFSDLYGIKEHAPRYSASTFNAVCRSQHGFYTLVGAPFSISHADSCEAFDKYLLSHLPSIDEDTLSSLADAEFVLWLGITGQKRSWIEQVQGCAAVAHHFADVGKRLTVLIDGWTSTLTGRDAGDIAADGAIAASLEKLLPPGTSVINLIGETPTVKIHFALHTDFFVANYSTGSIYVARFGKAPGVGHLNTLMKKGEHIHHNTTAVPDEMIQDIIDGEDVRADFVSYSISPETIVFLTKSAGL